MAVPSSCIFGFAYSPLISKIICPTEYFGAPFSEKGSRFFAADLISIGFSGRDLEPANFSFNHNGITLAAEKAEISDGKIKLNVPRLLNGAQTVTTVNKFCESQKENPSFRMTDLKPIKVLAK